MEAAEEEEEEEEEAEAAEAAGWSKKNKNPTWQCGESRKPCAFIMFLFPPPKNDLSG